jgi:hypothetical protein
MVTNETNGSAGKDAEREQEGEEEKMRRLPSD